MLLLNAVSLIAAAATLLSLFGMRSVVSGTTLVWAWGWALAALAVMVSGSFLFLLEIWPPVVFPLAGLVQTTMSLAALFCVLGARRPGVTAWQFFVILPMLIVVQWPAVSHLINAGWSEPVRLSGPALIGLVAAVVMGIGNYLPGALLRPAILGSAAIAFWIQPALSVSWMSPEASWCCGSLAAFLAMRGAVVKIKGSDASLVAEDSAEDNRISDVWVLWSDLYGVVWTTRVMARVNQFAEREGWGLRLDFNGFESQNSQQAAKELEAVSDQQVTAVPSTPTGLPAASEQQRGLHVLCWVLSRFVSRDWLKRRLKEQLPPDTPPGRAV